MIAFDFSYYKPTSINEAWNTYNKLHTEKQRVMYYAGGTEFISRARRNEINVDAIIDLKKIPACNELKQHNGQIIIGAATSLTRIIYSNLFPLLANVLRRIATNTERNKITIGGNLSSHLIYREAILPFLLADSHIVIAGEKRTRIERITDVFRHGGQLKNGEFIVQMITDANFANYPHFTSKQTKHSKINYPIVSAASLHVDNLFRVAFSGVCSYPFRSKELEHELNNTTHSIEIRVKRAIDHLPAPIINDMEASRSYREFVLKNTLTNILLGTERIAK